MKGSSRLVAPLRRMAASGRVRSQLRALDDPRASKERRTRAVDALISIAAGSGGDLEAGAWAVEGLLRRWGKVPVGRRARLAGLASSRLRGGVARAAEADEASVRRVVAGLGGEWSRAVFIRAAAGLVRDSDEGVAVAAEGSLVAAAERAGRLRGEDFSALDQALASLARRYPEHRRRGVLRAAGLVADRSGPELRAWFSEGDEAELMPLRAEMKKAWGEGADRARLVRLLGTPALAGAAADRLCEAATAAAHEASLALGPIVGARGRAEALRRVDEPWRVLPGQGDLQRLSVEARLGALSWAASLPVSSGKRAACLAEMLGDPAGVVRLGAVRRLGELAVGPGIAREALMDACFDADPSVAIGALEALARVDGSAASAAAGRLARSASAAVRIAAAGLEGSGEEGDAWAMIAAGEAAGWALLRSRLDREPMRVSAEVRGRIAAGATGERCLAVAAARRLGITGEVEGELQSAAQSSDERVAAAAVSALGEVSGPSARAVVSASLGHGDGRVRANALEAIARRDPDEPVVRAWVGNETPRARGNAVRARLMLAGDPSGAEALESMLSDDRRGHRLSGLWVAERAGLTSVSERVAEIARRESEPRVRLRAKRCARRLLAEMRLRENSPDAGEAAGV